MMGTLLGKKVGPYKINKLLGKGGMGEVYLATDENLDRHVALKVLKPELLSDSIFISRFSQEAKTMAKFNHLHIATLYTILKDERQLIMAMEYIDGVPLDEYMKKAGGLSLQETLNTIISVLEGLSHAHQKGIVHRDLKPSNIMFNKSGVVKVMDFGIARGQKDERHTKTGMIVGTLDYMAPELIKGEQASFASDLYAIGIIMYEALTGKLPFSATSEYTMMQAHVQTKPTPVQKYNSHIPKVFSKYTMKLLEKNPSKRFSSTEIALLELKKLKYKINPAATVSPKNLVQVTGEKTAFELLRFFKRHSQLVVFGISILLLIGVGIKRFYGSSASAVSAVSATGRSTNSNTSQEDEITTEQFNYTSILPQTSQSPSKEKMNLKDVVAELLITGEKLDQEKKYIGAYPSLYLVAKQILEVDKNNAVAKSWIKKIIDFYFNSGRSAFQQKDKKQLNQCIQVLENIAPNDNRLKQLRSNLKLIAKRSTSSKQPKFATETPLNSSRPKKPRTDPKKPTFEKNVKPAKDRFADRTNIPEQKTKKEETPKMGNSEINNDNEVLPKEKDKTDAVRYAKVNSGDAILLKIEESIRTDMHLNIGQRLRFSLVESINGMKNKVEINATLSNFKPNSKGKKSFIEMTIHSVKGADGQVLPVKRGVVYLTSRKKGEVISVDKGSTFKVYAGQSLIFKY